MQPVIDFQGSAALGRMAIAAAVLLLAHAAGVAALRRNPVRVRLPWADGRTYQPYFGSGHRPAAHRGLSVRPDAWLRRDASASDENRFFNPRAAFRTGAIHTERTIQR